MRKRRKGLYIAFEGIPGCGKSTQLRLLLERLTNLGIPVITTKEPGGDEVADRIRSVVIGTKFAIVMHYLAEVYLFAASRAHTLREIVERALNEGKTVLGDRSVFSSLAFQGFGREIGFKTVMAVNEVAVRDVWPDLVIHIDIPVSIAMGRMEDAAGDKFETESSDFHERCAIGYREIGQMNQFAPMWHTVDGTGTPEEVALRVWEVVWPRIETWQKR